MKNLNIILFLFCSFLFSNSLLGQTTPDCDDLITPPITDDMFSTETTSPCDPGGDVIFTYDEFTSGWEAPYTIVFGNNIATPPHPGQGVVGFDPVTGSIVNEAYGSGMTYEELLDCFEVLCSPQLDVAQYNFDNLVYALQNAEDLTSGQIEDIIDEANAEEEEGDATAEEIEDQLGAGDLTQIGGALGDAMADLGDLQSLIEDALGIEADCVDGGGLWNDNQNQSGFNGDQSGGGNFIKKMEDQVAKMAVDYFSGVPGGDLDGDPNWFLGEIEGLGMTAQGSMMPSPSSTSVINAATSGVDLYNGNASFSLALDDISSKDVSVPLSVNTSPGQLKVDDQEGILGANMNLSTGAKVTRVVKGLPDEFKGGIESLAYGTKRGVKPVSEFLGIDVGVDLSGDIQPKWFKRIVRKVLCKIVQILVEDLLDLNISGLCSSEAQEETVGDIKAALEEDGITGLGSVNELVKYINNKIILSQSENPDDVVTYKFHWRPLAFNYVNFDLIINIPVFSGIKVVLTLKFRAGVKIVDVPSPVVIKKNCVGYNHLADGDLGLPPLTDINDFNDLSIDDKLKFLNKKNTTRKREDFGFFNPKANYFLEIMQDFVNLFNSNGSYPVIEKDQVDLEPDEYYYNVGGYSGKFYFKSDGKIIMVPYQDIHITPIIANGEIDGFNIKTPDGILYTISQKATSKYDNYVLPSSFRYEEIGINRDKFKKPTLAKVEYPTYKFLMGVPVFMEVKKDYMTNYYVEKGEWYTSAWHVNSIRSLITQERIDYEYNGNVASKYNASKDWSFSFPGFEVANEGGQKVFKTPLDPGIGIHFKPTEWKNGFAELTYSMSEVFITEPLLKSIHNHRGKKAVFTYGLANLSMPGTRLCTRIDILKNDLFFKAWEFDYSNILPTPSTTICNTTVPGTDGSYSPAYANDSEYKLDFDLDPKGDNDKFIYKFPVGIDILDGCLKFQVPVEVKFDINDNAPNGYYYMNSVSELGSLMQLKTVLGLNDGAEETRFNAEFIRNFLTGVKEVDADEVRYPFATINYTDGLALLPKRFSIHQDIWGYYNGISSTMCPFISYNYSGAPNVPVGNGNQVNTAHFAFKHPDVSDDNFDSGRSWRANFEKASIGQINSIDFETGAFYSYDYDLHHYDDAGSGVDELLYEADGGIRLKSLTKGSSNGATKTSYFKYEDVSTVSLPYFTDFIAPDLPGINSSFINRYKLKEYKITSGWKPTNIWQMNKGGYVGYGKVTESFEGNGKIEHFFTNPNKLGYKVSNPYTNRIYVKYNRIFKWFGGNNIQTLVYQDPGAYNHDIRPTNARDWRLGLEYQTDVYKEGGSELLQSTINEYDFPQMDTTLSFPMSKMYQHLHYGSYDDYLDEGNLYHQVVDAGTRCFNYRFSNIIRFIVNHIITEHPYRHIKKWFPYSIIDLECQKVETVSSTTTSYFSDGESSSTTNYTYGGAERNLTNVQQEFSNGQTTMTEYFNSDNYSSSSGAGGFPTIASSVLTKMNNINYELPLLERNSLNGVPVSGNATVFFENQSDNRILPRSVWKIREGAFVLTGKFDTYADGMPTNYKLAKYGLGINPANYTFFPDIILVWNDNLQLESREMSGFTTSYTYDPICQLMTSTDVNSLTTSYGYDSRRRLETRTSPGALQVQTQAYTMNPLSIATTTVIADAPTQSTTQNMDGWGNPLSVVRSDGAVMTSSSYDNLFRPTTQCQLGNGCSETIYEPSPLSRVSSSTDAVGNTTSIEYLSGAGAPDLFGFTGTSVTDPNNHTSYSYADAFGKNVLSISGEGGRTKRRYDTRGRISTITNPILEEFSYYYNSMGLLSRKVIPGKGAERYWYDMSMKMVAKTDAEGNSIILDYDDIYRLAKVGSSSSTSFGVSPLAEESVNGNIEDDLLVNTYVGGKTWMDNIVEGIITPDGIAGDKTIDFVYDMYGRVENSTSTYSNGNIVFENFVPLGPLNGAGIPLNVKKIITGPDGPQELDYTYVIDGLLRQTTTSLTYEGQTTLLEHLVINPLDQVEQKRIRATDSGFLQNVDYTYDAAGKLLTINSPTGSGCIEEIEVCQFYWGNVESNISLEDLSCSDEIVGVRLDGQVFILPTPLPLTDTEAIESFVDAKIIEIGKVGATEVFYQDYFGIEQDFHISIMGSNLESASIIFSQICEFSLEQKECCDAIIVGSNVDFPMPGTPLNPDLFFEEITYNGLDISLIESIGGCKTGLMRNHYNYDADHRLIEMKNELFNPTLISDAYSTSYTYDPAGNIQSINRNGWVESENNFSLIDELDFDYAPNSSILNSVSDDTGKPEGFGKLMPQSNYDYDLNGNLIYDSGKSIDVIEYNVLNLPTRVVHSFEGEMTYDYTFAGEKIRKRSPEEERIYVGGLEYKDGTLDLIHIPNGRIINLDNEKRYQYYLTDHLGNTVVLFEDKNDDGTISLEEETGGVNDEVVQRNNYYPFGMGMEGSWESVQSDPKNSYLYNGKELDKDLGLDWYHYGARMYDPAIARWGQVDPKGELMSSWSTYNYTFNNPIRFIDPDGTIPSDDPIYSANGKRIIGYRVEAGQGPTQIAKDLNDNYSSYFSGQVQFESIVLDNVPEFTNVANGDGQLLDKNNSDFESGNIVEGQILKIDDGVDAKIGSIQGRVDSKVRNVNGYIKQKKAINDEIGFRQNIKKNGITIDDPKEVTIAEGVLSLYLNGSELGAISREIKENNDSIEILQQQMKDLEESGAIDQLEN